MVATKYRVSEVDSEIDTIDAQITVLETRKKKLLNISEVDKLVMHFENAARDHNEIIDSKTVVQDLYAYVKTFFPNNTMEFCIGLIDVLLPPKKKE